MKSVNRGDCVKVIVSMSDFGICLRYGMYQIKLMEGWREGGREGGIPSKQSDVIVL